MRISLAWASARISAFPSYYLSPRSHLSTGAREFTCSACFNAHSRAARGGTAKQLLPTGPVRTRFAPSPTGHLHLGSLRTALFNYLLAKKTGGQFILRVEDTDRKRTVVGAQERLCHDLRWAGFDWDEGPDVGGPFGPYNQSQRTELYQKHAQDLIQRGVAYRCFCPAETSAADSLDPAALATRIGGCQNDCIHLADDEIQKRLRDRLPHVVRFSYHGSTPEWTDLVYGTMTQNRSGENRTEASSIADTILLKSDGTPTYHLANVVDDHSMEITHVIRGTEWMSSTPLHVALYNGFGWEPPAYAHVGLLTDEAGNKLSKRNFDTDVKSLTLKHGLLPEALNNFLVLMGWSNPEKSDVRDLKELVQLFDLKFTKGNSVVSLDKLWYLQRHHARRRVEAAKHSSEPTRDLEFIVQYLMMDDRIKGLDGHMSEILGTRSLAEYLECIVIADAGNYETAGSFLDKNSFYLTERPIDNKDLEQKQDLQDSIDRVISAFFTDAQTTEALSLWSSKSQLPMHKVMWEANTQLSSLLTRLCVQEAQRLTGITDDAVKKTTEYKGLSKQLHDHLRVRLTFKHDPGPASVMIMIVLGYEEAQRRVLG